MGGGGALSAGLNNEVLVGAGETREPVQHLRFTKSRHRVHIPELRLAPPREVGSKGEAALTGMLDAGDGGR